MARSTCDVDMAPMARAVCYYHAISLPSLPMHAFLRMRPSVQRYLLGYEFPDTIMFLTAGGSFYVHASAKKREWSVACTQTFARHCSRLFRAT